MQRSRRLRRGVILGVVVVVVAWGVVVGVRLARADGRLRSGIALARAARAEVSPGDLTGGPAARTLAAARADFDAAHADVTGALVAPLTVIPVVDTQIRSIADLSSAAATVSQAGDHALAAAGGLLARPHGSPAQRVVILRSLASTLHGLRSTLARLDLGPRHGLLSALVSKRDTFAGDVAKLRAAVDRADGASAAAAALLGHDATYLLLAANNAEMRAGSGMALEVGTLTVRHGEIDLGALQPSSALVDTRTSLRAGGDIEARWGFEHPTFDFRDLLFSPQFAPNAALAARMWTARTGQRVSGVLLVDDTVVPDLLSVVGPVTAAGHTLDAADALRYLLIGQYAGLSTTDPGRAARHELLGALAGAAFQQATAPGTSLTGLAKVLDGAADGRHLLAWSSAPAVEGDWRRAGVAGGVGGDDLLLSLINQGGDKLDPYQRVTSGLAIRTAGTSSSVTVRVSVHNATPPSVRGYAAGGAVAPPRFYSGAVVLDFPRYAGHASVSGSPRLEAAGPDYGADVLAAPVTVPDGATRTVTFHFQLEGRRGALDVLPSARVPPTRWRADGPGGRRRFTDNTAHTIRW